MEEDSAIQAPITRLRRRMSVDQTEEVNSPGPATPTKKRGDRLAAKPQLELIDENSDSTSKKTKKPSTAKDITLSTDEKPQTPLRRSTRIKSNTSIVSETTQSGCDSPRAKRAARRISQVGSDNESTVTPVRQTRRTRKDSTSSIDKLEATLSSEPSNITEVIIEEDLNTQDSKLSLSINDKNENIQLRKSPRLRGKRKNSEQENTDNSRENIDNTSNNTLTNLNIANQISNKSSVVIDSKNNKSEKQPNIKLSDSSLNLIKELDHESKKKISNKTNKSMTALKDSNSPETQRHRAKSLTDISKSTINDTAFLSDNEVSRKSFKKNNINVFKLSKESGDNKETEYKDHPLHDKMNTPNFEITPPGVVSKPSSEVSTDLSLNSISNEVPDGRNLQVSKEKNNEVNPTANTLFSENSSSTNLQSIIVLEDSDPKTKSDTASKYLDSEDQCVPVVETRVNSDMNSLILNKSDSKIAQAEFQNEIEHISKNNSFEPMDVDVTIPNNTLISDNTQLNKSSDPLNRKSDNQTDTTLIQNSTINTQSKSLTSQPIQNLEQSENENKSTLIISQLKDLSSSENNVSKSPRPQHEVLSKSTSEITNENTVDKRNLSLDYSTSTPLQQKQLKKLGMQINTSLIEIYKTEMKKSTNSPNTGNKEISNLSESTDADSSSEKESETKSLLEEEATVASDDYESGDSQDEEERQYAAINEVLEKGETLDSEDEFSNDTDYEKDSFVFSSDEEEFDLLSGSGDDLGMSDNELTMSKKSKEKYNNRKLKEQKRASKEMFEARHQLIEKKSNTKPPHKKSQKLESSDDSTDDVVQKKQNKRRQINSTQEDSSDASEPKEEVASKKQYKHRRINSTQDDSCNANDSTTKEKTKKRILSESECNNSTNKEQEITIFNNDTAMDDPLSTHFKEEPKSPQKDINLSSVNITDKIEEINVDENVSLSKTNLTSDPLYASVVDDQSSSLSENSEIMNNYDSVLNQLNLDDTKSKSLKSHHTSINIDQKSTKIKTSVLDELNITRSKKSKISKNTDSVDVVDTSQAKFKSTLNDRQSQLTNNKDEDESSSDSIDWHLLFSEESRDFDTDNTQTQTKSKKVLPDDFIPLKRTPGTIDITEQDDDQSTNSALKFFIDTDGSKQNIDTYNTSATSSSKKKRNKKSKNNVSQQESTTNDEEPRNEDDGEPIEIPFESSKNDKRMSTSSHKKSGKNVDPYTADTSDIDVSLKKKKRLSESQLEDTGSNAAETSLVKHGSAKKKKKHSESQLEESVSVSNAAETSLVKHSSAKKKKSLSESQLEESGPSAPDTSHIIHGGVKKKKNLSESHHEDLGSNAANTSLITHDSIKKKKTHAEAKTEDLGSNEAETSLNVHNSIKKKKKQSESQFEEPVADARVVSNEKPNEHPKSAKKQKHKECANSSSQTASEETLAELPSNTKKRKRKSSSNNAVGNEYKDAEDIPAVVEKLDLSSTAGREKKKRKIAQNDDDTKEHTKVSGNAEICVERKIHGDKHENLETAFVLGDHGKKNKKRKLGDSDIENKATKKLKENSFDTVHVPRLPASILNQLDEKPVKKVVNSKKSKVISTTSFVVEETKRRKNKPSFYLEESVYLNDTNSEKKQKTSLKKPTVLPFVPTAATSGCGFTTQFKINVIPQEVHFVAKSMNAPNFKNDYLYGNKIKRLGTYEMYKKRRTAKLSKF